MAVTTGGQASTGTAPAPSETARQETIPTFQLSIRNKLLFAQAVHRLGAPVGKEVGNNWDAVIDLLRDCPVLTDEEKEIFTEHNCRGFYDDLMAEAGFGDLSTLKALEAANAEAHLRMAQYFYVQRINEMKATIENQEQQFQTLLAEIDAIKSGEAVYNPVLLAELRLAVLRIRNSSQKNISSVIDGDALKGWIPTKDQLRRAANPETLNARSQKSASPAVDQEPLANKDIIEVPSALPDPAADPPSAVASPSPTPTPTPSVVVNGEILKPYPSADIQSTERTDEVPPLQIQPKRPKDNFAMGIGIGFDMGGNSGFDGSHAERPALVKQEPSQPEPPARRPSAPPIRQDLNRAHRNSTASPSPSVSEMSAGTTAHRSRTMVDAKSAPTTGNSFTASPVSAISVKREPASGSRSDRPSTAGVYNHRKIPVKNAASHSVTSGPSLMGEKRSMVVDSPPAKDRSEAEVIVPDSQEVPDSQSEAGNDAAAEAENHEKVEAPAKSTSKNTSAEESPRKATRAAKRAETQQSSAAGPTHNSPRDRQSDEESNRSELTTPPASPALSAPPSSAERRVKVEDDTADAEMRSPPPSSPVNKSRGERHTTRQSVKEETHHGTGQRGKKRGRESEGGAPSTPAKRPYRKTGNSQSQDELSPAPPDHSAPHSKAGDTDEAERDDEIADAPRRIMNRRTSTRAKPPTIEEDSEADDGGSERNVRKRTHKEVDQASKSALQRRSGRFARSSPDKQHTTNTDETVDEEEEGSDQGGNKAYQPRKAGRFAKNSREAQADSDGEAMEDERANEKPDRTLKSTRKNQEAKKDAQQLPGENREELGKNEESNDVEPMTDPSQAPRFNGRTRSTRSTARTTPTVTSIKAFQNMINPLYEEIIAHKNGPLFLAPVRESDAPGYSKIVKQPMDLKKIKTKIRKGEISTIDEFQRDLWLIFCNAMLYNRPNSEVYRMAQEMMTWCENKLNDYRNLQHHIRQK